MSKRRVIESDDEDDNKAIVTTKHNQLKNITNIVNNNNDDWLDSRDPKILSSDQRKANIEKAKIDRVNKIPNKKPKRVILEDDIIEDESIEMNSYLIDSSTDSYSSSSTILNDSLLEDTPDVKSNLKKVIKISNKQVDNKLVDLITPIKSKKTKKEEVVIDNDEEDEEIENDWVEDLTKDEIELNAKNILQHCENISFELRKTLNEWSNNNNTTNDYIDLLHISDKYSYNNQVLSQNEIQKFCPDLILKDYQLVGVNWLKLLYLNNVNGVLADDMGLGKTVQTIAFLSWLRNYFIVNNKSKRTTLIVVPASTLANWVNEFKRFCPSFVIKLYHGSQQERLDLQYDMKRDKECGTLPDVMLTTYTIFEKESNKSDRKFFYNQTFQFLICDEGHCMKNSSSMRFVNLNHIKSKNRLLLSGTPVQNDLGELLSLLSFLMSNVFKKQNCDILVESFGWNKKSSKSAKSNDSSISKLRSMLAPFVLRRLKKDVLDQLTEKSHKIEILTMTNIQQKVYNNIISSHKLAKEQIKIKQQIDKYNDQVINMKIVGSKVKTNNQIIDLSSPITNAETTGTTNLIVEEPNVSSNIIESSSTDVDIINEDNDIIPELTSNEANHLFTELRKAANHPLLLRVRYNDPTVLDYIAQVTLSYDFYGSNCKYDQVRKEIENSSDFDIHSICLTYPDSLGKYILTDDVLYDSPKMQLLKDLLPKLVEENHRILIFSQWTRILDLLTVLCEDIDMDYLRLDGSTPVKERQDYIDQYNKDPSIPIFLLSTKAGGLGINLCAADVVILHDLDFNPENDRQAEDRCHRIGQTRPVTVYKLVAKDTVDELIYEMGERKRQLSEAVLSDHRIKGKLKKSNGEDDDIGAIGWILKRALSKVTNNVLSV